jgi:hypothetical protein
MKNRLIVAFLALGVAAAACDDSSPPPGKDGSVDARAIDAGVPGEGPEAAVDTPAADGGSPDLGGADRAEAAAADASSLDGRVEAGGIDGSDAGPGTDGTPGNADGGDGGSAPGTDAGVTCGPGASREMLCTSYCNGMGRFCAGASAQYGGDDACRAACNAPTWACGSPRDVTGNSVFCRVAHMALAGVGLAARECPNAGPSSPTCR